MVRILWEEILCEERDGEREKKPKDKGEIRGV
jgi:hypothetical protein